MEKKRKTYHLYQRAISLLLSVIIGLGTFVSLTVSNAKLLDILHIRNVLTAYADDEVLPQFYREGELVGIYNPDYTSTDTIYYKIGENGDWTEYEVPVAIPAFSTTTVYAKIGSSGTVNGDDFNSSRLAIGAYTESNTDFSITYNNLTFDFYRCYDSRTNEWFYGNNWSIEVINDALIKAQLLNGEKLHFVRKGNVYYNELNSYAITVNGSQATLNADDVRYIYTLNGSNKHLIRIEDLNGNYFNIGMTLARTDVYDPEGRHYLIGSGATTEILSDIEDDDIYAVFRTTDPTGSNLEYFYMGPNGGLWDNKYLDVVKDQAGKIISKYQYADNKLSKSNDKSIYYINEVNNVNNGRVSSIVYDSGEAITYTYDDENMTYTESSNQGGSKTTVYNDAFLPVSVSDGITTTTYTYDSKYRLASETTDGVTITYTYDSNGNLISSESDDTENGVNTDYTYDNDGRVTIEKTGDDYTYYSYNTNGDVVLSGALKDQYKNSPPQSINENNLTYFDVTEYNYDSNGRLIETSSDNSTESYTYDQYGNTTSVETEYTEDNETVTDTTTYTYDVLGNVLTSTQDNETTTYTYDDAGRTLLVNDNGKCTRTLYDDFGRVVQEIDPEDYDSTKEGLPSANTYSDSNVGQRYHYNSQNQIDYEINRLNVRTDYTYHNNGVKATEDFDIYNYSYNPQGNVTQIQITGTTTPYATYNYDTTGLVLNSIDYGNGQSVLYEYNNDGKVKKQKYKASANVNPVTQFVYEYGTDGELSAKIDINSERYTAYSGNSVTVSELVTTVNNNETEYSAGTLIYSYTDTEEATENGVTTPATSTKSYNGNTVGITYNENSTAYTINNSSLFSLAETNDEANHTSATVLKDSSDNTLFSNSYTYDTDGNVTGMTSGGVSTSYVYDTKGRITEYHQGNEAAYYTYDSKGQLIREDLNYTDYQKTKTYQYNSRGNVTRVKEYDYTRGELGELTGQEVYNFEYEDEVWLDELQLTYEGFSFFSYDDAGNPTQIELSEPEWTNGRQLKRMGVLGGDYTLFSGTYDDEGIRTRSSDLTGTTRYYTTEDGKITSQYALNNNNGEKTEEIIFLYNGEELFAASYRGRTYYYVKNAMGDVISVLNEEGENVVEYAYNAWGDIVKKETLTTNENNVELQNVDIEFEEKNPITYRSYYCDISTGMYYLQSRYYMPVLCRFINADIPDIAQQSKDEINGLNLFAYCNNDPVNNVDPSGYKATYNEKNIIYYIVKEKLLKGYKKVKSINDSSIKKNKFGLYRINITFYVNNKKQHIDILWGNKSSWTSMLTNEKKRLERATNNSKYSQLIAMSSNAYDLRDYYVALANEFMKFALVISTALYKQFCDGKGAFYSTYYKRTWGSKYLVSLNSSKILFIVDGYSNLKGGYIINLCGKGYEKI